MTANTELPTRSEIVRSLKKGEVTVKFRKADKTLRVMRCTLQEGVVPTVDGRAGGEDREVVVAYDLDKRAWRSFRMDALKSVKVATAPTAKIAAKSKR